ncbi:MAG TPA: hypothetical protein VL361_15830 [Candidatus Limnocylindrales bacterium]|jgi:hypothetical protein|nr:hypothetical protein [Candidatus Limnocylindrales bacterium]
MKSMVESDYPSRSLTLAALLLVNGCLSAFPQNFSITGVAVDKSGTLTIRHQASPDFYYILYRSATVDQIGSAVAMALGGEGEGQLTDQSAGPTRFFRVRQVPVTAPLDTDGDGIDDVWELRFRKPGAALNAADANEDQTGDGTPDLQDAQKPLAYFARSASSTLKGDPASVGVVLTRPYSGRLLFQTGGTAQEVFDYTFASGALQSAALRYVDVSGTSASLALSSNPDSIGDGNRQVVLSLVQPADNSYRVVSPAVHTVTLQDSAVGVYTMALVFTNGASIQSQAFKVSLRSGAGGTMRAQLSGSAASMFPAGMAASVQLLNNGVQFKFLESLAGQLAGPQTGDTLPFQLQFSQPVIGSNVFVMTALLQVGGLSASGKPLVARGAAFITRNQLSQP